MIRVLIVAPEIPDLPRLAQVNELTRLADVPGIMCTSLIGLLVTEQRIQSQLRSNAWDVLLWPGHGADGRLLLPNGATVEPRWLASEVRRAGVHTVILAVCDSAQQYGMTSFTNALPAAGVNVIAVASEIADTAAVDYDVAFLHALVNGETVRQSHDIGLEAILSTPDAGKPQLFMADSTPASLKKQVAQIEQSISNGDNAEALALARQFVAGLEDHEHRITALEHIHHPPLVVRAFQTGAALAFLLAVLLLVIADTREIIYRPLWVGAIIDVALLGWALLLWRMAITTRDSDK